ncbi:hypothetical protein MN205_15455 [Kineococcus sp. TRM81007]|uniref:hypothetical protein n=1 Tax=Kineococcus sp. TRM81007 TaxID=2925831 RepID=UPI001F57171D|nr:hypothetical protein [Kineococcus sp. TRM81007]MCI2239871.1 hypothetical protein [Kineococcus sp. TRM81007]
MELLGTTPGRVAYRVDGHEVSVAAPAVPLTASGDAEVALGLLPALKTGRPLSVDLGISPRLGQGVGRLQEVLATWLDLPPVPVHADTAEPPGGRVAGVGCFFSGGVDSFHSALRRRDEITHLIFVRGFDIPVDDDVLGAQAAQHAREAADALGKELVEVTTDLRRYPLLDKKWEFTHGAALAAVAHSLSGVVGKVYVPASRTYNDARPWGSHPLTDPLWSGDAVDLVHDGADATRVEKIGFLAREDVAARHLRVCWENRDGRFNCSQCEKCTRTMVALRAHGVLDRFTTFSGELDLRRLRSSTPRARAQEAFTRQTLRQLESTGADPELESALRWQLRLGPARRVVGRTSRRIRHRLTRR